MTTSQSKESGREYFDIKVDFRARNTTRDKRARFIMTERSMTQEDMKENLTELQGETDKSTIIIGDFNTSLSVIDRTSRQKS